MTTANTKQPASVAPASYSEDLKARIAARTASAQAKAAKLASTPEQSAVAEAEAKARQAAAAKAQAEKAAADMQRALEKMQREVAEAAERAQQAAEQEERARREIIDAQRTVKPEAVTLEVAESLARSLVEAFEASEITDAETAIPALWDLSDDVRCRLLTDEVAPDAQRLVLAMESVLLAMDEFEHLRMDLDDDAIDHDRRRELEIIDIRASFRPSESGKIARRLRELQIILNCDPPPKAHETIGQLVAQGLSVNQICKMLGFLRIDGGADLAMLGTIIDSALSRYAYYQNVAQWQHLASTGAMSFDEAWNARQHKLEDRRKIEHGRPGSPARAGELRLGRRVHLSGGAPFDPHGPHFRAAIQKMADRRAAAAQAAAAASVESPNDDEGSLDQF